MPPRASLTAAILLLAAMLGCTGGGVSNRPAMRGVYHPVSPARPGGGGVLADFEEPQALAITLDAGARRAAAQSAEREWLAARCTIPLFEWPEVRQVSTRLRNFTPIAAAADTWNAADWWLARA